MRVVVGYVTVLVSSLGIRIAWLCILAWLSPAPLALGAESQQTLIELSVAATDKSGSPVTDLGVGDIQVRDDGKVRPVVFWRQDHTARMTTPAVPGEYANRAEPAPLVILFDRWNERLLTAASGSYDINKALEHLESVDRVFIYFLTARGDLFPVHPIPGTDADLQALGPVTSADLISRLNTAIRKLQGFRDTNAWDPVLRANTTFQTLDALFMKMASISGRKSLVWVTHGVPLTIRIEGDWLDFTSQVRALSAGAAAFQIAMYPVAQSAQGAGADLDSLARETLDRFAAYTGGRLYTSGSADNAMADATKDARGSYRLAYYAPAHKDHKEHKIRVDSTRKDVRLLTRQAYTEGVQGPDSSQLEQFAFSSECRTPYDATDIGLRAKISRDASGGSVHVDVAINPADVLIEHRGDRYEGELETLVATYAEGFLERPQPPLPLNVDLTDEQFKNATRDWIHIQRNVTVSGQTGKIRFIVYDRGLHGLGSVTIPLVKQ